MKIMVHNSNSCCRCKPLVEILGKDTITEDELKKLGASKREEWDGDDKGRKVINTKGYVLSPLTICPHYQDSRAITFKRISDDGKYKRVQST